MLLYKEEVVVTKEWRCELNRLATEFWFHSGDLAEVTPWVEAAYEAGETGVELAELWGCLDNERVRSHLQQLAREINGFEPWSAAAQPFAIAALEKGLRRYIAQEIDPSALCQLIANLDAAFLDAPPLPGGDWWMGNLWNCCDWCDASWTFDSSPHLKAEAISVLEKLALVKR